ncbi:hypothetical protein L3Y34_003181 [Caenorhabditis briggsae]|uniref:Homeobox domain-containing protein n=2 Tax=Caenorhabditis briggsae TaxID=6238 RepID=A0AAE9D5J2_CAEBR|nr:hypothetical protein L3Y34_003181 [Caenorhabditis briggsae]
MPGRRIPNEHVAFLMSSYRTDLRPKMQQRRAIAGALGMNTEQVVNWFKKQHLRETRKAAGQLANCMSTSAQYAELRQKFEANPRPKCKEIIRKRSNTFSKSCCTDFPFSTLTVRILTL